MLIRITEDLIYCSSIWPWKVFPECSNTPKLAKKVGVSGWRWYQPRGKQTHPKQQRRSSSSSCIKKAISRLCKHQIWSPDIDNPLGEEGYGGVSEVSVVSTSTFKGPFPPPTHCVYPYPSRPSDSWDLSLSGFSPQWGPETVLAQA